MKHFPRLIIGILALLSMSCEKEEPFLDVSPSSISFGVDGGSQTVTVKSNTTWNASAPASWISISPSSGSGDGTVGMYQGGDTYAKGVYRPTEDSMMNNDQEYFNAPSREAIYKRIMELSGEKYSFEEFVNYDLKNIEADRKRTVPGTKAASSARHR